MRSKSWLYRSVFVLILLHAVGLIGMLSPWRDLFFSLTPIHLVLASAVMLLNHGDWKRGHIAFLVTCFVVGFFAEVAGVHTGLIFGDYAYGTVLGPKLFAVPLVIGVNWLMLVYGMGMVVVKVKAHWIVRGILAATLMVLLDVLIEPVAIASGFWSWVGGVPPFMNYVGWFVVAAILQLYFYQLKAVSYNAVAVWLMAIQAAFFGLLNLFG